MDKNTCVWRLTPDGEPICLARGLIPCEVAEDDVASCPHGEYSSFDPESILPISEMYPAISGEGSSTGRICTIVRTVGCNLRCTYCDTTYAYEGGENILIKDIMSVVEKYGLPMVLLTGGEPLLHTAGVSNLLRALLDKQITVYVETNGAVDIRVAKFLAHIVMDVKTPSSGMQDKMLWDNMKYIGPTDDIKFVVSNKEDYAYVKDIIARYSLFSVTPNVYISPVWNEADMSFTQELSNWLVQDRSEARLMLQQHKCIWGPTKRGV